MSTIDRLSQNARVVLYRLQTMRGNALYVIPSLASPDDRDAIAELEPAGLVQIRDVQVGIISRQQVILTAAGRARRVSDPWNPWGVAS